jgi:two-component system, OmpR family, phosphate regulon sensor histidine kinase PhoR
MSDRKFRIRSLLILASLLLAGTATLLFYLASSLSESRGPAFLMIGVLLFAGSLAGASFLGRRISEGLRKLRAELPDLARGDRTEPLTRTQLEELDALVAAIGRYTQDVRARERTSEQERAAITHLLEAGTEGLLEVNEALRIVYVNAAARVLLGLPGDARGQPITALVRQAELRDLIVRAVAGETPEARELSLDERHLVVSCHPVPSGSGAVVTILDYTDIRRLEAVRRDFVGNVSHELKTPLTSIRGYAETLMSDEMPRELQEQFLEVIYKNTVRIQHIVDDLLDLTRLQSGGWNPKIQPVNAAELVEDVWSGCSAAAKKKISFELSANGEAHVAADPEGLRQVLSNLFDNAIRYTPEGGHVDVRIAPYRNGRRAEDEQIELLVRDTGSGIPRESLPRIFERFYRVDPARSRQEGGTGLGLSIVKHLVERMDGEVSAESELGKGTTIRLRLPAA